MDRTRKLVYAVKVHTAGGREGAARSNDGRLNAKLSTQGNPEQLFPAGCSARSKSAMRIAQWTHSGGFGFPEPRPLGSRSDASHR
jgi:osmotically inducible protein OsmC